MATLSEVPEYVQKYFERLRAVDRDQYLIERSDYWTAMMSRDKLVDEELGGDAHNLFKTETPREVKDRYNDLSSRMVKISSKAMDSAVIDVPEENLKFLKTGVSIGIGWYQNAMGRLYHYDGVIWDDVPEERIQDLEFLGN